MAKARIFFDRTLQLWFYRDIIHPEEKCGDGYDSRKAAIDAARKSKRFTHYFSTNENLVAYGINKEQP